MNNSNHSRTHNVWRAIKTGTPNIYTTVSDEVADEMGISKDPLTRGHNDGRDAFRHAYTSALVTYRYGFGTAETLGDLNEAKNNLPWKNGNPPHEEWMDQRNNKIGRDIAMDVLLGGGNEQDLKRAIKEAYDSGKLIETPYDPRRTFYEHGDWQRSIKEAEEMLEKNKHDAIEYLRRQGELTPENLEKLEKRYNEHRKNLEKSKKNIPLPSKPSDIRTGPSQDTNSTIPLAEVFVKHYERRTGRVKEHKRTWPDGHKGNNLKK